MIAVTAAGKSSQLNEETTSPSPPVRSPHPLEAWAEPRSPFEPVISRPLLGGISQRDPERPGEIPERRGAG